MKILFVTESLGVDQFGVAQVLLTLHQYLNNEGISCHFIVLKLGILDGYIKKEHVTLLPTFTPTLKRNMFSRMLRWHPRWKERIVHTIRVFSPHLIHVHGVWSPLQSIATAAAKHAGIPVLISPHGMLEPWTWKQKGFLYSYLKRKYWEIYLMPKLWQADYMHVITRAEAVNIKAEFPNIPQIYIPNAIDLNDLPVWDEKGTPTKRIVFLGRLHPKKGVDLLIRAFVAADLDDNWRLDIVGPDFDPAYSKKLKNMAASLDLSGRISFMGPVYGEEKYGILQNAWVVVVPSYSEVVALVNLESAAMGTPSITTTQTGLHDWQESGGLLIEPEVEALRNALMQAASWTMAERLTRGQQARQFVTERYSWDAIGPRWVQAYQKIVGDRN